MLARTALAMRRFFAFDRQLFDFARRQPVATLAVAGLLEGGGATHIAMTLSLRYTQASLLTPFEYMPLIGAVLADVLLFDGLPDPAFAAAAALLVSGALLVARHEVLRARRR